MVQLTWNDIDDMACKQPCFPECWKTCENFSNYLGDGQFDFFMDYAKGKPDRNAPRCVRFEGKPRLIDNRWYMPCKRYEAVK